MANSVRYAFVGLAASLALAAGAKSALSSPHTRAKHIEVAFVLDTTGSMAGLIDGAKRKIWSIANSIVDINPNAEIRMALIGYRDIGDDYVVKSYEMSDDIQGLYGNLLRFRADGGGDGPESVNEALDVAISDLDWSDSDDVRRIVFLVGDAPPHMDYQDDRKYPDTLREARQRGIIVNTVQAGEAPDTFEYWQEMAKLGGGKYFAIPQDGGQVDIIASPYDNDILKLQQKIDGTVVPYGTREQQAALEGKISERAAAPAAVQVDNSEFYSKRTGKKEVVTGGGDLLDDVRNNVRAIEDIKDDELPTELKGKSADELRVIVTERTDKRAKMEAEMTDLVRKRDEFVAAEAAKQPKPSQDSFDRQVEAGISAQF